MTHFPAAPWSPTLKLISVLSVIILLGTGIWALHLCATTSDDPMVAVLLLGGTAWGIVLISALFMVRGYTLDGQLLRVQRLLWSTTIDLHGITAVSDGTLLYPGSLRLFGNAGVLSFCGLFYNRRIGTYRAFVTNWGRAVVLERRRRPVVVSPSDPKAMAVAVQAAFPQLAASRVSDAL